jgi:hypothetical protein
MPAGTSPPDVVALLQQRRPPAHRVRHHHLRGPVTDVLRVSVAGWQCRCGCASAPT